MVDIPELSYCRRIKSRIHGFIYKVDMIEQDMKSNKNRIINYKMPLVIAKNLIIELYQEINFISLKQTELLQQYINQTELWINKSINITKKIGIHSDIIKLIRLTLSEGELLPLFTSHVLLLKAHLDKRIWVSKVIKLQNLAVERGHVGPSLTIATDLCNEAKLLKLTQKTPYYNELKDTVDNGTILVNKVQNGIKGVIKLTLDDWKLLKIQLNNIKLEVDEETIADRIIKETIIWQNKVNELITQINGPIINNKRHYISFDLILKYTAQLYIANHKENMDDYYATDLLDQYIANSKRIAYISTTSYIYQQLINIYYHCCKYIKIWQECNNNFRISH